MAWRGVGGQHVLHEVRQREAHPYWRQRRDHGRRQQDIAGGHDQHQAVCRRHLGRHGVAFAQQLGCLFGRLAAILIPYGRAYQRKWHGAELPRLRLVVRPMRQADVEGGTQNFPVISGKVARELPDRGVRATQIVAGDSLE
jgi:hypothetical protein